MTDIVERLDVSFDEWTEDPTYDARQDAIAEIASLRAERDAQADTIATLQAKLDKAVEGLGRIAASINLNGDPLSEVELPVIAQSLIRELRP